jgi:hypothetical protein
LGFDVSILYNHNCLSNLVSCHLCLHAEIGKYGRSIWTCEADMWGHECRIRKRKNDGFVKQHPKYWWVYEIDVVLGGFGTIRPKYCWFYEN